MEGKITRGLVLFFALLLAGPAQAAVIELSGMLAYSKSDFADGYRSVQRRYTATIDFKFTQVSAIEFEYTDSKSDITYLTTLGALVPQATREDITYRDKVYSFNWVQNLVPSKWILQPYIVFGGGRMVRHYTAVIPEYEIKNSATQNVTTGTAAVGLRIFVTRAMAVKSEYKTYVPSFRFSKWKENQLMSIGLSWAL